MGVLESGFSWSPHPALRATFSRKGRRECASERGVGFDAGCRCSCIAGIQAIHGHKKTGRNAARFSSCHYP